MRFSPGIYEHAAALIDCTPWEVSRDRELLAQAHHKAWEFYRHPMVVVGIDVYNLEAEAYGATILEPNGTNIPAISTHPCTKIEELLDIPPLNPIEQPRIREVLKAGYTLSKNCPNAEVYVPICGPFALAIGLLGMDELLMGIIEDREPLINALNHLLHGQVNFLNAIHETGLKPIFFESGTTPPLLSVKDFTEVEAPLLQQLFTEAQSIFNEHPACIIGGDAAQIADPLFKTNPGFLIAPSETDQAAFMDVAKQYPQTHVRVNMPAGILLQKEFPPIRAEADLAIALAKSRQNTSVGCGVVPHETNPDMLRKLRDYIETGEVIRSRPD